MVAIAAASYILTKKDLHQRNAFSFGPFKEVAVLFFGIFGTMMPALGYLAAHGQALGFTNPLQYYFGCGALSAVLDNAPAYLNFLQLAQSTAHGLNPAAFAGAHDPVAMVHVLLEQKPHYVIGLSLGSVFFGAMTYIGNGPNFMVKAIAHESGVHCPTFSPLYNSLQPACAVAHFSRKWLAVFKMRQTNQEFDRKSHEADKALALGRVVGSS